jgi:beta-galactosidase
MSIKQHFNTDWKFTKQKIGCTWQDLNFSHIQWQPVDIPHDWLIYEDDLYETSEG